MRTNYFKDLLVWEKSISLTKSIYEAAEKYPKSEEYNLKQQLKRAVTSISLNIAEGKNRKSKKEFANFINISIGSLGEVEAILVLSEELELLDVSDSLFSDITELSKMLSGLHKKLIL